MAERPIATREQRAALIEARKTLPADAPIPYQMVFSLRREDFTDKAGYFHEALYLKIRDSLEFLERRPYGQDLFRDILNTRHITEPIAIRTEFSRKSSPELSPMETVAQYIKGQDNELIFNTGHMASFGSGPFRHWGFHYPALAILHEGDHAVNNQLLPMHTMSAVPAPILMSRYEASAMRREQQFRDDPENGVSEPLHRSAYFEFAIDARARIASTKPADLERFRRQGNVGAAAEASLLNLYTHMAFMNNGHLNADYSMEDAQKQAETWLSELYKMAGIERRRTESVPLPPNLPKLRAAHADPMETEGGLPAHLRTATARTIV